MEDRRFDGGSGEVAGPYCQDLTEACGENTPECCPGLTCRDRRCLPSDQMPDAGQRVVDSGSSTRRMDGGAATAIDSGPSETDAGLCIAVGDNCRRERGTPCCEGARCERVDDEDRPVCVADEAECAPLGTRCGGGVACCMGATCQMLAFGGVCVEASADACAPLFNPCDDRTPCCEGTVCRRAGEGQLCIADR